LYEFFANAQDFLKKYYKKYKPPGIREKNLSQIFWDLSKMIKTLPGSIS
jgi:hypothetical protein